MYNNKLFAITVGAIAIVLACLTWLTAISQNTYRKALLEQSQRADQLDQRIGNIELQLSLLGNDVLGLNDDTNALASSLFESASQLADLQTNTQSELDELSSNLEESDISRIVAEWEQYVFQIACTFDQPEGESTSKGSVVIERVDGNARFITNEHVLTQGIKTPTECTLVHPATEESFKIDSESIVIEDEIDFGYGAIDEPVTAISNADRCASAPEIGDSVVMLGYPKIGSGSSVTATDGIISGIDEGFYITSAKIDKGSSGGAAVHVKNNCLLGLPTIVAKGGVESLARILPLQ